MSRVTAFRLNVPWLCFAVMMLGFGAGCELSDTVKCDGTEWICPPGSKCSQDQMGCIVTPGGNGVIEAEFGEESDGGNVEVEDGCLSTCDDKKNRPDQEVLAGADE